MFTSNGEIYLIADIIDSQWMHLQVSKGWMLECSQKISSSFLAVSFSEKAALRVFDEEHRYEAHLIDLSEIVPNSTV